MTDNKNNTTSHNQQSDVSNSSSSRLSRDETMDIFLKMANNRNLKMRNINAFKLFGQGVWIIQAKSSTQLKSFDTSRSVYVPMSSLGMFFSNPAIMKEKIDPTKEMLLAATYLIPGDNTLSYIWTKATIQGEQQPSVKKEITPPVQEKRLPKVNLPSVVNEPQSKNAFRIKPKPVKRSGTTPTSGSTTSSRKRSQ